MTLNVYGSALVPRDPDQPVATLTPLLVVVFVAFLVIGLVLPVLPLHVHDGLGLALSWSALSPSII